MTTDDGSSLSQSRTHAEAEQHIFAADKTLAAELLLVPLQKLLQSIFAGTVQAGDIDRPTAKVVAEYLQQSLFKGFGSRFTQLPFGSPKHKLRAQLHYNVAVFAAFKNHRQIQDIVAALKDKQGVVRSFAQFKRAALAINKRYAIALLQAECQTAILQGQAAAKWQRFAETTKQAQNFATATLRSQVQPWSLDNLMDKTFTKEGLTAHFTHKGIKKILNQPHNQKYYQLLTLLDFERLLKKATTYKRNVPDDKNKGRFVKAWHYFEIDINGIPSLINIREETNGKVTVYSINKKSE